MSLQLSYTHGAQTGNYWKMARVDADYLLQKVYVRMELFEDAAAKAGGSAPICSEQLEYSGSDFTDICVGSQDARAEAYAKVKTYQRTDGDSNVVLDYTAATDV